MNKIHYFQKRSHLDLYRADLWQIEAGIVRAVTCLEDGSVSTLGFWGAGDVVGKSLFRAQNYQLECLSVVMASPLQAERCSDLVMLAHIHQLEELLLIRSCKRIEETLLKLLTWLAQRFGDRQEAGLVVKVLLTHQDLAETLNTTRVTITRCMGQLERQGLIHHLTNRWLLIDKSACSSFASGLDIIDRVFPQRSQLPPSTRHSSIRSIGGVAAATENLALSIGYR
jgi:CRP-like cAMP-binding protein